MARIRIRDLQKAPDMAILVLDHQITDERQQRRVPAAITDKYRQHADGSRDFDLAEAWNEVPGLDANWRLVAWFEGVESVDNDIGWLEEPTNTADFYQQTNSPPDNIEDLFFIWVPGEPEPREYPLLEYTVTRDGQDRVSVTPNPPGIVIDKDFLDY